MYSEKATKFCEMSSLLLPYVVPVKSKVEISQNFVAFLEYLTFKMLLFYFKIATQSDIFSDLYDHTYDM